MVDDVFPGDPIFLMICWVQNSELASDPGLIELKTPSILSALCVLCLSISPSMFGDDSPCGLGDLLIPFFCAVCSIDDDVFRRDRGRQSVRPSIIHSIVQKGINKIENKSMETTFEVLYQ